MKRVARGPRMPLMARPVDSEEHKEQAAIRLAFSLVTFEKATESNSLSGAGS